MSERMADKNPTEVTEKIVLRLAADRTDRTLSVSTVLAAVRAEYWDYADSDWNTAFASLLVRGVIALGQATATIVVAPENARFAPEMD